MWSLGCIAYELFNGQPLFAGEDENQQMMCIMEVIGLPPSMLYKLSRRKEAFFKEDGSPILHPNERGKVKTPGEKSLHTMMESATPDFVDFVE